jgi:hypothetical protein
MATIPTSSGTSSPGIIIPPAGSTIATPAGAAPAWKIANFPNEPMFMWSATNRVVHHVSAHFFPSFYVWCSPVFEGKALGRYSIGAGQPPSSDPASIYRALHAAVCGKDEHNADVERQKEKLRTVALDLQANGMIDADDAAEVVAYVEAAHISAWTPMIYVIPYVAVKGRVWRVPRTDRASGSPEFVIRDLRSHEFEAIEPMPCN